MCKWGTDKLTLVRIPASLSHTSEDRLAIKPVDSCIADIIQALVMGGIWTTGCCCGHGKADGYIGLADGRYLVVKPNKISALKHVSEEIDDFTIMTTIKKILRLCEGKTADEVKVPFLDDLVKIIREDLIK